MGLFTIDRTTNFEEQKIKKLINIIKGSNSVEEIEDKMINQNVVSLRDDTDKHGFFRRRWVTFLKEFGLYDGQNLTEMAKLYANNELNSKEFALLFLVNRVVEDQEKVLRPLEILIRVSFELKSRNQSTAISENELKYVVSKIGSEKECNIIAEIIIQNRNNAYVYDTNVQVAPCHYDIWRNLLKTAEINVENSNDIELDLNFPIIKKVLEYYNTIPPKNDENYKFDSKFVGFIRLPKKTEDGDEILLRRQNYKDSYSKIIYKYLFEMSINNIEQDVLNARENGNIPYKILNGFRISTNRADNPSNMRLYHDFMGYEGIIINKLRKTGDAIYSFIGSNIENYLNESFKDEQDGNEEWIFPANPLSYDHEAAFNKFGFIDWSQTRNVNVGDVIFLYRGSPEQRIFAMGKVEIKDLSSDEKVDDSAYCRNNATESSDKFFRIKLIKYLNDDRLSIKKLEKHGLVGAPMGGQRLNEQLSEYIHFVIDNAISIENPIEVFKNYYLSHLEDFKNNETETERIKSREDFKREYPISRLRTLSIDEYALGTANFKETLSYYLEFGKYRYAGPGIGGATSAKHGFYKRDDGKYYGIKNKPIDNPTEYWEAFKNQMADFFEECGDIDKPLRASSKYPLLQGMNMVLTKLLYVYYPTKYTNVCSKTKLRDLMKFFNYDFSNDMQAEELNFLLNKNIRFDIPELSENDPQYIGSTLWKFVNELENENDEEGDEEVENDIVDVDSNRITGAYNKIVYGIPGCGKSFYVSNTIVNNDINKGSIFRTTFYPDYTNGDFVGQVIPKLNNKDETSILYDIQSGPFTDALLDAVLNPNKNTYLIIEEINRGNAAAIFGDIFQLLDRNLEGTSEYPIKNYIISTYLHKKIDNKYSVYYDLDNIKIPSNLILIGTMNTSDQNVFTLDTAFKRRWKMEYIQNKIEECIYANYTIPMSNVTWAEFVNEINDFITSDSGLDINGEDKQIGSYFITGSEWKDIRTTEDSKEAARIFAEKVLSYIWDDVAKINRDSWFDSNKYRTLDSLVSAFTEKGLEVFGDNISFTREEDKD